MLFATQNIEVIQLVAENLPIGNGVYEPSLIKRR